MTVLRCIVYVSTVMSELTTIELKALLTRARAFNLERRVIGVLLCTGLIFMQCFESAPDDVYEVHGRMQLSSQHTDIVEDMDRQFPERTFGSWEMSLAKPAESKVAMLSAAEWSRSAQQALRVESPAGLQMLKMF